MRMLMGLTLMGSSVFVGAQGPAPAAPTPMFDVASMPAPPADTLDTASLFAAIQEQLGLKLEATRAGGCAGDRLGRAAD